MTNASGAPAAPTTSTAAPAVAPNPPGGVETPPSAAPAAGQEPAEGGAVLLGGEKAVAPGTPFDAATFEYPEGLEIGDPEREFLTDFTAKFKVPAEGVKALLDQYTQMAKAASDRMGEDLDAAWSTTSEGWATETKTHYKSEVALNAAIAKGEAVINEFGSPEIFSHLSTTGLGNNLAVLQMFEKIGAALGEGRPIPATGAASAEGTILSNLYPTMVKKD